MIQQIDGELITELSARELFHIRELRRSLKKGTMLRLVLGIVMRGHNPPPTIKEVANEIYHTLGREIDPGVLVNAVNSYLRKQRSFYRVCFNNKSGEGRLYLGRFPEASRQQANRKFKKEAEVAWRFRDVGVGGPCLSNHEGSALQMYYGWGGPRPAEDRVEHHRKCAKCSQAYPV